MVDKLSDGGEGKGGEGKGGEGEPSSKLEEAGGGEGRPRLGSVIYRSYPRRWAVLASVIILNISNAALWINMAPVTYKAADYFQVSVSDINWFSLVFLLVSIPFSFVSTFTVNLLGLRPVIYIGSSLNCLGAVLRAVSTSGLFSYLPAQFAVSLTGQTFAAMAQCFILFIPTKVSQLWFPEDARTLTTSALSLSNPLGVMLAQVVTPFLVQDKSQLPTLNHVFGGVSIFGLLVALVSVTRSKPPTPPSQSAEVGERERAPYLQQLKDTFTSVPYLLLLVALGCGVGLFSSFATVTQQLLCPLGYTDLFSGVANAVMIFCGFVGSAVTGILADRTKAFAPITMCFFGLATVFGIMMMEMFMVPGQPALVAISVGLFGFFGLGTYPIGLELAVETTYPVEESISAAFIFMSGQIQGVVIIALVTLLAREQKPQYVDISVCTEGLETDVMPKDYTVSLTVIMAVLAVVVCLAIFFFNTPYKRLEADQGSRSANPSISCSTQSLSMASSSSSRRSDMRPRTETSMEDPVDDEDPDFEQCHL